MDEKFRKKVRSLKVAELRHEFPGEAHSHRAMLNRERAGEATVHDRFRSFKHFLLEVGERPNKDWTLDRIDPYDPEYAPGKVRWADKRQQANNRTNTIFLNVRGEIKPLTDWARQTGQPPNTIRQRLRRGKTHEEAIFPRRGRSSPDQDQTENDLWPQPLTPRLWEPHYKKVEQSLGEKGQGLTRRVFALWIEQNRVQRLRSILAERYPNSFDPDLADPYEANIEGESDPHYQLLLLHMQTSRTLMKELTEAEQRFLVNTLSRQERFVQPADAAKHFQRIKRGR